MVWFSPFREVEQSLLQELQGRCSLDFDGCFTQLVLPVIVLSARSFFIRKSGFLTPYEGR